MANPKPLPNFTASDIERFWAKVLIIGPGDCWPWQAGTQEGYGIFQVAGRAVKAHRVAYFLSTGRNPSSHLACHTCDNPPCCNPQHLFPGDWKSNQEDCVAKDRKNPARGTQFRRALFTDEQIMEIRTLYETGTIAQADIAAQYGCSRRTISAIIRGVNWSHLPILAVSRRRVG
jgi:HNH endonuclease